MWKLVLLFTVLPALELYLLLQLGSLLGPLPTVGIILGTGVLGGWLAKREGLAVLRRLFEQLGGGLPPAVSLVEGGLVVAGGLLLVTPGVITDLTGFALIFPPTRRWIAPRVLAWLKRRFVVEVGGFGGNVGGFSFTAGTPRRPPADPEPDLSRHFDHPTP
jgi:UPF0716 protein FxsA